MNKTTSKRIGKIRAACIFAHGARPTDAEYGTFKRIIEIGDVTLFEQQTMGM